MLLLPKKIKILLSAIYEKDGSSILTEDKSAAFFGDHHDSQQTG
jgi:hypothetical protein